MTTIEERKAIQRMTEQGYSGSEIAAALGLKTPTVYKWRQRLKKGSH